MSRSTAFQLFIGLALLSIALYFWYADTLRSLPASKPEVSQPTIPTPPGMVYVPGGAFEMGMDASEGGDMYDSPKHTVSVKPFFIDVYEVTNADYAKFISVTHHTSPASWGGATYPVGAARKPVTGVSWVDANAYAEWAKKRLPTEVEWEFAARGPKSFAYPWGNQWESGSVSEASSTGPFDVGGNPHNKSPFGVFDMVGNVWEWTATDLHAYKGEDSFSTVNLKVIRGCGYKCDRKQMRAAYRRGWPKTGEYDYSNTGFRCAEDVVKR